MPLLNDISDLTKFVSVELLLESESNVSNANSSTVQLHTTEAMNFNFITVSKARASPGGCDYLF